MENKAEFGNTFTFNFGNGIKYATLINPYTSQRVIWPYTDKVEDCQVVPEDVSVK